MKHIQSATSLGWISLLVASVLASAPAMAAAQATGSVSGEVSAAADNAPLRGISVSVQGTG
ncbi:MAG: hypothetical protein V3R24_08895, partial [Gemmatimonadales bacterium]